MKIDNQIIKYILSILFLFIIGCAAKEKSIEENGSADFERWKKLAEYTQAYSPSPRDIETKEYKQKTKSEHLAEAQSPVEKIHQTAVIEKRLPTTKVSMQMHNVDIGVLFRTLAKAADVNIILNKSITGKINVNIKEVPWSQVFKGLLSTHGYTYVWIGDIISVVSIGDLKTQASLMDAKQMMELKNREHDIALLTLNSEKENLEPLKTRVVHVAYADPEQLRNNLWEFFKISKTGYPEKTGKTESSDPGEIRGSILVDAHTNSLMIQATSNDMIQILELMEKLDKPTPQIRIEAFIVETTGETARELGMQWGGLGLKTRGDRNTWLGGPVGSYDTSILVSSDDATADGTTAGAPIAHLPPIGTAFNFPSSDNAGTEGWKGMALGLMTQKLGNYMLYAQLTALQEEGKLNILSKPSITTLDNQKAIIESGRDIPYTSLNDGENTVQFKKAVLKLEATPHVVDGDNLKIKIVTNKDELDFSNDVNGNPVIITKYAETEVVLQDGQTTVIGGLRKESKSFGESGVPGLKDIPVLGLAFKQEEKNIQMEDILIFITPYILKQRVAAADTNQLKETNKEINVEADLISSQDLIDYHFSLQVGVFANKENADKLSAALTQKGYSPYFYKTMNSKNKNLYSVRIKNFLDLKSALDAEYEYRKKENKPAIITFYNTLETVPKEIKKY
ncbi:MAG: type IV pilus secretin PilQ [Desulfobacteraceae bacterium]|nr:type IV pilus secretin PilQ [Desulfobacteraceae bacterium]